MYGHLLQRLLLQRYLLSPKALVENINFAKSYYLVTQKVSIHQIDKNLFSLKRNFSFLGHNYSLQLILDKQTYTYTYILHITIQLYSTVNSA